MTQTYDNVEHIVVDGGSTDGTIELLKLHPHLHWISEPDTGMYDAINKGIKIASGEVLSYLNADDRYFPSTLAVVATVFQKYQDVDFVIGACTYINEKEEPKYTTYPVPNLWNLLYSVPPTWAQPACFWRKSVHDKIGLFDNSLKYCGDLDFFQRMSAHRLRSKLIHKPLAKFMRRTGCLSRQNLEAFAKEEEVVTARYPLGKNWRYVVGEVLFITLNLPTYPWRLVYRARGM